MRVDGGGGQGAIGHRSEGARGLHGVEGGRGRKEAGVCWRRGACTIEGVEGNDLGESENETGRVGEEARECGASGV